MLVLVLVWILPGLNERIPLAEQSSGDFSNVEDGSNAKEDEGLNHAECLKSIQRHNSLFGYFISRN